MSEQRTCVADSTHPSLEKDGHRNLDDYIPNYDLSRENLLRTQWGVMPQPSVVWRHIRPNIPPPKVKPKEITEWVNFDEEVRKYWCENVSSSDKEDLIANSDFVTWNLRNYASQKTWNGLRSTLDPPFNFLTQATQGQLKGQRLPSDKHSHILHFQSDLAFVGNPDYIFVRFDDFQEQRYYWRKYKDQPAQSPQIRSKEPHLRVTAAVIVKRTFEVNPESVSALLKGHKIWKDETEDAVDQIFGYLAVNAVSLGIISTMDGWIFLQRKDGGNLLMTQMYGCDSSSGTMEKLGYAKLGGGYTINQALYYFSHLAEMTPECVEHWGYPPGDRYIRDAGFEDCTLPTRFEMFFSQDWSSYWIPYIEFEPWKPGNRLGPKNWIAKARYRNGEFNVMLKLWDPCKIPEKEEPANQGELRRDNEVAMYKELYPLWGDCVPRLIAHGPVHFCHGLIIQFIEHAEHLSKENLTPDVEKQVLEAYEKIHGLKIEHDRPKPGNILVAKGKVWIIDFERSERFPILEEGREILDRERECLLDMIKRIKQGETYF